MPERALEKSASQMSAEHLAWSKAQPMRGGCAFCPEFSPEGTGEEVMAACAEHRMTFHPDRTYTRRKRRTQAGLVQFSQSLTDAELVGVQAERTRRMQLLGIPG